MDELVRDRIHEALEVEPAPPSLRARVMDSLPVSRPAPARTLRFSGQWAAGVVATLLAIAIIAGLLYSRGVMPFIPARHNPAPPVGLVSPEGVAVASDGTVYVSDFVADRIFLLRPNSKAVVYAGGGSGGDGPATKASLFHPVGLALDSGGNLYIADTPGGTVRKVDNHGNLSTRWSASTVTDTPYPGPLGLAIDPSGGVWVSQLYGSVGPVSGAGIWVDGSSLPPPQWLPGYMAFDHLGNLYISDEAHAEAKGLLYNDPPGGGCRIVRMSPAGTLTVIAGTGVCGWSGDGGPARLAQIDNPQGIAFDAAGNLYFADANNHRIRRIDTGGIITTVAGTGSEGEVDGPAGAAQLRFPFGMAMSRAGLLYFAEGTCSCWSPPAPGRVRVLNLATGMVSTVMTGSTPIGAT